MSMATLLNATHDAQARSWLDSANVEGADFPIQNLPFAVFRRDAAEAFRGGVAIGEDIVDLAALAALSVFESQAAAGLQAAAQPTLNALMQQGPVIWSALRHALFDALLRGSAHQAAIRACLVPQRAARFAVPAHIGDYTDFFISIHHATAVGRLFRPDNPLMPNYKWVPIGYHGRSSSIGVSGQSFPRPQGQRLPAGAGVPTIGPSQRLDYELEMGIFIGGGNSLGVPISMAEAENHIFGLCLLNDWSARDIQAWEYQPLGPFLAKSFATTISPWVVTLEALAPFRMPLLRPAEDPQPLPYLDSARNRECGAFDIRLEVLIETSRMRAAALAAQQLSMTSFRHSYWTVSQLVAHHTVNGCNLRPGDLFGSGTQSGPVPAEAGSLLELSVGGTKPLRLVSGETRTFLEDGDTVIFRGRCEAAGATPIGFGELRGCVLPPRDAAA
jgi:fumarylacetoacetase